MNEYDPVKLVKEATRFAQSDFGKHRMAKVQARVDYCRDQAVDLNNTRAERADWGIRADEARMELDYYRTAQATAKSPSLLAIMAENFKNRVKEMATKV